MSTRRLDAKRRCWPAPRRSEPKSVDSNCVRRRRNAGERQRDARVDAAHRARSSARIWVKDVKTSCDLGSVPAFPAKLSPCRSLVLLRVSSSSKAHRQRFRSFGVVSRCCPDPRCTFLRSNTNTVFRHDGVFQLPPPGERPSCPGGGGGHGVRADHRASIVEAADLVRHSGHVSEGPREEPGHAGETRSLSWPGNVWGSPRKNWKKQLGKSGCPRLHCSPRNPAPDERTKTDGLVDGWMDG